MIQKVMMYLIDTNVISEIRKKEKANSGVQRFFVEANQKNKSIYISVITIGELRRGIEKLIHRGDIRQANQLEDWLKLILNEYQDNLLVMDEQVAQLWGKLRVPHHEHALDKQISATAILNELTVVTRNVDDFRKTGAKILNPFD